MDNKAAALCEKMDLMICMIEEANESGDDASVEIGAGLILLQRLMLEMREAVSAI